MKSFQWRRLVTLATGMSLFCVASTGFGLFIAPAGRLVHGGHWLFWGMNKPQLLQAHLWFSVFLLIFVAWHFYFNRKSLGGYLSGSGRKPFFTIELLLTLLLLFGVFLAVR